MSVEHETFVIERVYALPPARVFAAWADPGLHADQELASVSLAAVTFAAEGDATRLTLTEQIALLDELDTAAARERGMRFLLGRLGDLLPAPE